MLNNVDHVGHILCVHLNLSSVLGTDRIETIWTLIMDKSYSISLSSSFPLALGMFWLRGVSFTSPRIKHKSVFIQRSTKYRQLFQFLFKEGKHPMSLDSCLYMRIPMESLNIKCYVTPFLAAKIRNMFSKIGQSVL